MTIKRAALLAAIGVLLRGAYYMVTNLLPLWNAEGLLPEARVLVVVLAIVDPLVWTYYFVSIWLGRPHRAPALIACVLGLAEIIFAAYRQFDTFSLMSLDTMAFFLGAVVPVVCWTLFLLGPLRGWRIGLWYLMLSGLVQGAVFAQQMLSNIPQIQQFWREEPRAVLWSLIAVPLIWIAYWGTQALFVRAAQKA